MIKFLKTFRKDEDGAVTVDWVVLTAAVVGLAIAAYGTISENAVTLIGTAATAVSGENDTFGQFGAGGGGEAPAGG
ncbi:Flp family type IVb pilin [Roseivivax sp. CAU 1761]